MPTRIYLALGKQEQHTAMQTMLMLRCLLSNHDFERDRSVPSADSAGAMLREHPGTRELRLAVRVRKVQKIDVRDRGWLRAISRQQMAENSG